MRCVDYEHVGASNQRLQNLLRARRLRIERDAALVAVGEVRGVGVFCLRLRRNLVPDSPQITRRRLNLNHLSAKVGQDHRGAWTRDETREVHDFQARKYVVTCHDYSFFALHTELLTTLELRPTLLKEGRSSFPLIFRSRAKAEEGGLQRQTFGHRRFHAVIDRL